MILLLVAGIGFVLAGLLAILFGVPVKEFSFGNTLILSGVVATGTGAILLGLYAAVRELKSSAVGAAVAASATLPRVPAKLRLPTPASDEAGEPAPGNDGFLFPRDQPTSSKTAVPDSLVPPLSGPESTPAPWQQEAAARDRARERGAAPPPEPAPPEEPAVKPRRNLLFSSSSRKERERLAKAEPGSADAGAAEAPVAEVVVRPTEPPPRTFEEAWPETERARADAGLRRSRTPPNPGEESDAAPPPERPAARSADTPQVTVLKSGVVDGMAYSLYSDGSIEAQMPEGMMRFASIDELRSHLDQRP